MHDCVGEVVEIVETQYLEDSFRVRGKLKAGVWITLLTVERDARKVFARPFLPGCYALKVESDVRVGVSIKSAKVREEVLLEGSIVEVAQVRFDEFNKRVRGLAYEANDFCQGWNWITLVNMNPGEALLHAAPYSPGVYEMLSEAGV